MEWESYKVFDEEGPAKVLASLLESEGMEVRIQSSMLAGARENQYHVAVEKGLLHKARWFEANAQFSEEEIEFLATGKLPGDET